MTMKKIGKLCKNIPGYFQDFQVFQNAWTSCNGKALTMILKPKGCTEWYHSELPIT